MTTATTKQAAERMKTEYDVKQEKKAKTHHTRTEESGAPGDFELAPRPGSPSPVREGGGGGGGVGVRGGEMVTYSRRGPSEEQEAKAPQPTMEPIPHPLSPVSFNFNKRTGKNRKKKRNSHNKKSKRILYIVKK